MVEDRYTALFSRLAEHPNNIVSRECAARGVFLSRFVPNTIMVAPPLTITQAQIDTALAAFDAALTCVDRRYC